MIDDFVPARARRPEAIPVAITDSDDDVYTDDTQPDFRPPESMDEGYVESSTEQSYSEVSSTQTGVPEPVTNAQVSNIKPKRRLPFKLPKSSKEWLILAGVILVILLSLAFLVWKMTHKPKPVVVSAPVVVKEEPKPAPTTAPSKLTGVEVSLADAAIPVTAVMIENSPDARPQSGLKDAGVVYEAIAEGGITRFLTLFQEAQPDYIGPIRSVRPYYLDWLVPFDAPVAHVGGSPEAIAQIRAEGIKDLDYAYNSKYYHRVSNRYAPHNVYTSRAELLELQKSKGWTTSVFTGWPRKADKASATPNAKALDFTISSFLYNPHFDYDVASNSYKRSQAGKPHIDEKSGQQISPKVVIAIVVPKSIHPDRVHTVYGTHGSGKVYIFQDGTVTEGIWEKKDRKSEMKFGDANGSPLALNKGNTWISVVGDAGAVKYTP